MAYSYDELVQFHMEHQLYPMANPEFGPVDIHRMEIERWLWDNRDRMAPPVLDIGAEWRREYAGREATLPRLRPPVLVKPEEVYRTVNVAAYDTPLYRVEPDIAASITALPFEEGTIGTIICTETLEHVPNLFRAVAEIKRVLRPGGWAFMSSPFFWPEHDTENYGDYWRLTRQGWLFLFHDFATVRVTPNQMRRESKSLLGMLSFWEVMGNGWEVAAPTGYMVAARKGVADEDTVDLVRS